MTRTDAWVLPAGGLDPTWDGTVQSALHRRVHDLGALEPGDALVEPLLGSWEANIDHALSRTPIDVCSTRGEDAVVLGNLGLVRVLEVAGAESDAPEPGTICMVMPFGVEDAHGYAELVHAYDCPGTLGLLARRSRIPARLLLPVPTGTRHTLRQWAAYARYFTAWDNWHRAVACWRSQMADADPGDHLVLGWGGGVSLAELSLAKRHGFHVAMTVSGPHRAALVEQLGIVAIDRTTMPEPGAEPEGTATLRERIDELSDGRGAAIVIDNIGTPLWRLSSSVLARQGVLTSCGWKAGMRIPLLRGAQCIGRHIHVHTHVWRHGDSAAIRDEMETDGWIAPLEAIDVYGFDDVPALAKAYAAGEVQSYFPLYEVNPA